MFAEQFTEFRDAALLVLRQMKMDVPLEIIAPERLVKLRARLDNLIETREEFDQEFRRDYFEWHIHYHLAADERRGIAKFCELLRKHNLGPVFEPKFVS